MLICKCHNPRLHSDANTSTSHSLLRLVYNSSGSGWILENTSYNGSAISEKQARGKTTLCVNLGVGLFACFLSGIFSQQLYILVAKT